MLIFGLLMFASGAGLAFWPNRQAQAVEDRIASGEDRYFEERRALAAYPSLRQPKRIRMRGFIVMAASGALVALELFQRL